MKWENIGTAVKITIIVPIAFTVVAAFTSCKPSCDGVTEEQIKNNKKYGHCTIPVIPIDPNKCKPLEDDLKTMVADSTYWHGQMVDLKGPALEGIENTFDKYVEYAIDKEGYATDTDLDWAKLYKRAIELLLEKFPDDPCRAKLELWFKACDEFEKAAPKPAPQREAVNNCKSDLTAMTSKEKIKQGSNIMAGSPFA